MSETTIGGAAGSLGERAVDGVGKYWDFGLSGTLLNCSPTLVVTRGRGLRPDCQKDSSLNGFGRVVIGNSISVKMGCVEG